MVTWDVVGIIRNLAQNRSGGSSCLATFEECGRALPDRPATSSRPGRLEGRRRDGGSTGWRTINGLDVRHGVHELFFGAAIGNRHMGLTGQVNHRSPEYDVRGARPFDG